MKKILKPKQTLPKILFSLLFLPLKWNGLIFVAGFFIGREVSQAEYRFLERRHKWEEITWKTYIDLNNYKAKDGGIKDTLLDIAIPLLIFVLAMGVIELLEG